MTKIQQYEQEKKSLQQQKLTPTQYAEAIKQLAKRLKI
jgi:hypothetical protein